MNKSLIAITLLCLIISIKAFAEDKINVTAKTGDPSVPGAIVCKDYDFVNMAILTYREYSERALRQSVVGKRQEELMHGPLKNPSIDIYGCILVKSGSPMFWDGNWMPAAVSVKLSNGKIFKGVTDGSMIKQESDKVCHFTGLDCDDYKAGKSNTCYETQVCE